MKPEKKPQCVGLHGRAFFQLVSCGYLPQGIGNTESTNQCRPYTCLLRQLLKAGGIKVSESQLLELLKVIKEHCSWFPTLGTSDSQTWEKVGHELKLLHAKGKPIPITIWPTWTLIHSVLELYKPLIRIAIMSVQEKQKRSNLKMPSWSGRGEITKVIVNI